MKAVDVTPCSRQPDRFDISVKGGYDTFLDQVTNQAKVDVLSRTPYLTIFTVDGERYAAEKNREEEDWFTVTVTAADKQEARRKLGDIAPGIDVNLKE